MSVANASIETTWVTMSRLRPGCSCDIDVRERLQPRAEFAAGAAHPFGHRANQPVIAGQQGDDPVGFAELVLAQHYSSVSI